MAPAPTPSESAASSKRKSSFLPGMVAGVVETVAVQPLDMVKTRFQISEGANPSLWRGLVDVAREGGIGRFYRGLLPEMASTAPARTAMYTSYTWTAHLLKDYQDRHGRLPLRLDNMIAGFVSGGPEALVVTPLQLVKVRLQAKEHLGRYRNAFHCTWSIITQEGIQALFLGMGPTAFRNCVFNGVYFWAQSHIKAEEAAHAGNMESHAWELLRTAGGAFMAGALATCFNAPFDTAKSRMQQQVTDSASGTAIVPKYRGTFQTLGLIAREEGIRAIYKGFVPKVWRMAFGGAIGMSAFELTQKVCAYQGW